MFALFPEFGARIRPQDLWPFLISETGLKFLIWTQGKIHPGNSLLRRGLFVLWGGWGERKRERTFSLFPSSTARFQFFDYCYFKGIPSGSLCGGEGPGNRASPVNRARMKRLWDGVKILTCIQLSVKLNQQPLEILEIFVSMIWVGRGMHSARGAKITKCHVIRTKERKHTSLGENERGLMYDELLRDRVKEFQNSPHSRSKTSESSENIPGKTKLEKHLWRAKSFWGQRVRPHLKNDNNDHCNGKTSWSVGPQAKFS